MEPNNNNEKKPSDDLEELEELIEKLKELEEEKSKRQKQNNKKKGPRLLTIEFGGAFHPNIVINFLFGLILNITLSYIVIELFDFATYSNIKIFLLFIMVYTIIEGLVKYAITAKLFEYILQTMGMILYFSYLLIFFVLDVYVFDTSFTFSAAQTFVAFGTIFIVFRYVIGTIIKRHLRTRLKR